MNVVPRILAITAIILAIVQMVSLSHGHSLSRDAQYIWVSVAGVWALNFLIRTFNRP